MNDEVKGPSLKAPLPKPKPFPPKNIKIITKPKTVAKPEREQSSVGFPYQDMGAAISVARAMLQGGGVALTRDQLAGVMNQSAGSGAFVTKVATARIFGLIAANNGKYELTDLGFEILDNDDRRQKTARAESFLTVPLYKRVYDEFRGKQLPPRPLGLELAFVKFGVAAKQKTNARLAFDKSAEQAGFFKDGKQDRLIAPIIAGSTDRSNSEESEQTGDVSPAATAAATPVASPSEGLHPFIHGLLDTLPEPQTNWTVEGRAKWLQAAANIFDLIYKGSGNIEITAKNEKTDSSKNVME